MPAKWLPTNIPEHVKDRLDEEVKEWRRATGESVALWQVIMTALDHCAPHWVYELRSREETPI